MGTNELTIARYQYDALRTAKRDQPLETRMAYGALAFAGEVGEYCELVKKLLWHGHELDRDAIVKELGDICWYLAFNADCHGADLGYVYSRAIVGSSLDAGTPIIAGAPGSDERYTNGGLALASLAGVYAIGYRTFSTVQATATLGVALLMVEQIANHWGYALTYVLDANIEKLRKRYPEGFSTEASLARVDVAV